MLNVDITQQLGAFQLDARFSSDARLIALFGRSGAGKTSILSAIAGAKRPDRGHIEIDNVVFFDSSSGYWLPPEQRRVGYVFQDGLLFPHLTVAANLQYANNARNPATSRHIELSKVVDLLGLAPLLSRLPRTLSGGERQRVAIGRALLSQPRLMLLDEPLASVDGTRKSEILTYIEQLRDEFGIPIVLVSHALDEVIRLADQLVLIDDGKVRACGDVDEIMGNLDLAPLTGRHEAGAVIETHVVTHDPQYLLTQLDFDGGTLSVPRLVAGPGQHVRVRIRARDVSLARQRPTDISINNMLDGVITDIRDEPGAIVDVRIRVGKAILLARITRLSVDRLQLHPGAPVVVLVKAISLDRRSLGYA